jgi:BrnA antitoxin of type II toxin-antitoxin system
MASDDEVLQRLEKIEAGHRDMNGMVADLRDALIVTAGIQRRQAAVQKTQAEELDAARELIIAVEQSTTRLKVAVDEVADKLNGLIGYLDNLPRQPPQAWTWGHTTSVKASAAIPTPPGKERITIRLDSDILDYFRDQVDQAGGGNYQTTNNAVLPE